MSFLALEMARIVHDQSEIYLKKSQGSVKVNLVSHSVFRNIQNNIIRQRSLAIELMKGVGIQQNLICYGLECLPLVQEFYDKVLYSNL
jgi:hypothetical protein